MMYWFLIIVAGYKTIYPRQLLAHPMPDVTKPISCWEATTPRWERLGSLENLFLESRTDCRARLATRYVAVQKRNTHSGQDRPPWASYQWCRCCWPKCPQTSVAEHWVPRSQFLWSWKQQVHAGRGHEQLGWNVQDSRNHPQAVHTELSGGTAVLGTRVQNFRRLKWLGKGVMINIESAASSYDAGLEVLYCMILGQQLTVESAVGLFTWSEGMTCVPKHTPLPIDELHNRFTNADRASVQKGRAAGL